MKSVFKIIFLVACLLLLHDAVMTGLIHKQMTECLKSCVVRTFGEMGKERPNISDAQWKQLVQQYLPAVATDCRAECQAPLLYGNE